MKSEADRLREADEIIRRLSLPVTPDNKPDDLSREQDIDLINALSKIHARDRC